MVFMRQVIWNRLLLVCTFSLLSGCLRSTDSSTPVANNPTDDEPVLAAPPDTIDPLILSSRSFNEASPLAELVHRGELPPVADRLPENPLVVRPLKSIGHYGGTLRRAITGDIAAWGIIQRTLNENLMGYERPIANSIELNMAESYEFQDEGHSAVFRIRKGIHWSDGVPLTADDFMFWHHDVAFDDDAREEPIPPSEWLADGQPIQMEKLDDYTIKVYSTKPLGRVLNALSHEDGPLPKHVWSKIHPRYHPEFDYDYFREHTTRARRVMEPGIPRISAWVPVEWVHGQRLVYERNPYYWKIDTAGNQLPYLDRIEFTVVPDPETVLLKFLNQQIDLHLLYVRMAHIPTLRNREPEGFYKLRTSGPSDGPTFYPNWDVDNPALREAFRDRRVRLALSYAINREEISQIVFHGLLTPSNFTYLPSNPYYSEKIAKKYTEFDPDRAKGLLDEAGYLDTNGDGFRELHDGSPFEFTVDLNVNDNSSDICELVMDYWKDIGIKMNLFPALWETTWARRLNGDFEMHYGGQAAGADPLDVPHQWGIYKANSPFWYRNADKEGPEWLHEVTAYLQVAMTTIDPDVKREAMIKVRDIHAEQVAAIVIGHIYDVWAVNTRLGNVPDDVSTNIAYRGRSRPLYHEQIFVKQ